MLMHKFEMFKERFPDVDPKDCELNPDWSDVCSNCGGDSYLCEDLSDEENEVYVCKDCNAIYYLDGMDTVILKGTSIYGNWAGYLGKSLEFPFKGIYSEEDWHGYERGAKLTVQRIIVGEDYHYGVLVSAVSIRGKHILPLCDLALADTNSPCFKILDNYRTWSAIEIVAADKRMKWSKALQACFSIGLLMLASLAKRMMNRHAQNTRALVGA
jgi:hypothetical protein